MRDLQLTPWLALNVPAALAQVVRNLPCLRTLPGPLFNALLERGSLVTYKKGEVIWRPDQGSAEPGPPHGEKQEFLRGIPCKATGIYIIMAGLARTSYTLPGKASEVWSSHQALLMGSTHDRQSGIILFCLELDTGSLWDRC